MFKESITVRVINAVVRYVASAYESSLLKALIMRFAVWFNTVFMVIYKESFFYRCIMKFADWLAKSLKESSLYKLIMNKTPYEESYSSSTVYGIIGKILDSFIKFFKKVCDFILNLAKGSLVAKLYHKIHNTGCFKFEYICGAFFCIMMIVPHDYWNNLYSVAMAFAFVAMYIVCRINGRNFAFNVRALTLSFVAFAMAIVGAVFITPVFFDGVRIALFFIASLIFTLVLWGSISDVKTLKTVVMFLVAGLLVMCIYAIYQSIVGVPIDHSLIDVNANKGMPGRVYSTFGNPNNFAETIVLVLPFVCALFLSSESKKAKLGFGVVFAICIAALAVSYSRSCYVAFAITAVVFILMYDWKFIIPLAAIAIVCIPFLPETIMNRILTIGSMEDSSNAYRPMIWEGVIRLIKDTGLSGIGIGPLAFAKLYPSYANPLAITAPHSHMLYMEIFVELGIVGFFGFFGFMYASIKKGLAVFNSTNKTLRCMIIAVISALAGISFTGCAEYIWFYPRVMFVFWIVIGILLATVRISKKQTVEKDNQ